MKLWETRVLQKIKINKNKIAKGKSNVCLFLFKTYDCEINTKQTTDLHSHSSSIWMKKESKPLLYLSKNNDPKWVSEIQVKFRTSGCARAIRNILYISR